MVNAFFFPIAKRHYFLLCVACLQICCDGKRENEVRKVNDVISRLIDTDNRSDLTAILNSYTDSIEFYPAGGQFTRGIDSVKKSYEKLLQENKLSIQTHIIETEIFDDHATITGINTGTKMTLADSVITHINDRYFAILLYDAKAGWKINKLAWCKN